MENFGSLNIEIVTPSIGLIKEAARLALRHHLTVYDAVYAAPARTLGCDFVTADKKIAGKLGALPFVRTL